MPIYQYQCSSCEGLYETLATMTEDYEDPLKYCPKCDPDEESEDGTMFKYLGNCRPSFKIEGGGVYNPGWH